VSGGSSLVILGSLISLVDEILDTNSWGTLWQLLGTYTCDILLL